MRWCGPRFVCPSVWPLALASLHIHATEHMVALRLWLASICIWCPFSPFLLPVDRLATRSTRRVRASEVKRASQRGAARPVESNSRTSAGDGLQLWRSSSAGTCPGIGSSSRRRVRRGLLLWHFGCYCSGGCSSNSSANSCGSSTNDDDGNGHCASTHDDDYCCYNCYCCYNRRPY